jgi:hypothetical protein
MLARGATGSVLFAEGKLVVNGRELVAKVLDGAVKLAEIVIVETRSLQIVSTLVLQFALACQEIRRQCTKRARRVIMVRPINHC